MTRRGGHADARITQELQFAGKRSQEASNRSVYFLTTA